MLGETESAMDVLDRMYRDRDPGLTYLKTGMYFVPLRGTPRFEALLARMQCPQT
jgi:hypothetical protein